MEPTARIKSGLIAVTLGLMTVFNPFGVPFSLRENRAVAQTSVPAPYQAAGPAYVAVPGAPDQHYAFGSQRLLEARKALAFKDIVLAERLALEVKAMNLVYQDQDDRPEYVLSLIHQQRQLAEMGRTSGNTEQYRRISAALSLQQASALLRRGELELASQLTKEAEAQNVVYNQADVQNGLEPQTMFRRIEDAMRIRAAQNMVARQPMEPQQQQLSQTAQWQLNQAVGSLSQARTALNNGQLDRAELLCRNVIGMNLPESVFPQGSDSPNRLLAEIAARRSAMPVASNVQPINNAPAVYHPTQDATQTVQVRDNDTAPAPSVQPAAPVVAANSMLVDQAQRNQHMVVQQIASEVMQMISDANKVSREKNDSDAALHILAQARNRVESAPLDPQTKTAFIRNIDNAVANTVQYTERHQAVFDQNALNQQVLAERRMAQEMRLSSQEKLKTYVDECNKLIDEQRYEEAVMLAKKARDFAPDEPVTHLLLTTTQLHANLRIAQQIEEDKREGFVKALREVDVASIPFDFSQSPVQYGPNWRSMMGRRIGSDEAINSRRPESEREICRQLEMPVSLNFDRPQELGYVLQLLSGQTGVEIFVDHTALHEVDVTTETPVSIQLMKEIKLKSVLNLVLNQLGLTYIVKNEMLNITSISKAKGEYYSYTYYVGDLIMGIPNFNGSNPMDMQSAMDRAMQHSVSPTALHRQQRQGGFLASNTQVDPNLIASTGNQNVMAQMGTGGTNPLAGNSYNMQMPQQGQPGAAGGAADFGPIMDLIEAVVSPDSWNEGGAAMQEYYPNLSLVIRQTEEVHSEIVELLAQLRRLNDLQITVEVRFITLSDNFFERVGLDFNMKFKNGGASSRVTTTVLNDNNNRNNNNDNDPSDFTSQTVIGGNNVTVGLNGPMNFTADLSVPFSQTNSVLPQFGGYQAGTGLSMGFALLSDIETYFFLQASQGDSRANVLQAPRVTIFNGQMGSIMDITMTPFVTSVIPVVGDFAAAYQPIIVILNEGQYMTVQGTVSSNRQYVRLTLNPVFSKITKVETYKFVGEDSSTDETQSTSKGDDSTPTSGDERASSRRQSRNSSGVSVQLPILASLMVQTTVSVPDGGTILLGGIKRLSEARQETGTPILNKIPYLQRLFMNTAIGRDTTSVMMMVTPRIVIQEEEEEFLFGNRP